ncbi:glycosyltransferase family 4 protein [Fibrella forsythiae]|uniref:Glycosyltransferase family 4 protein n=1 Tax=Fibrella forsythiae TaxID=2817061 RepID=A0ABS3JNY9_9BACT|nr:glycosyltransferase family 4 protein [Fibrella forsythiae]MBO0951709.1 glycosyltransferase family 4 protein [Fibrella forsythiae]
MKLLFITPVANRSGSVTTLLNYMHYAPKNDDRRYAMFSRRAGQLDLAEFNCPLYFSQQSDRFSYRLYETAVHKLFGTIPHLKDLQKAHDAEKADLWYINTIAMPDYALLAIKLGQPYVLHVHELVQEYDERGYEEFKQMLDGAKLLFTASRTVVDNLQNMGYKNVVLMHGLINVEEIKPARDRTDVRKELGFRDDEFVWLMSGAWSNRKGFDMVPDILREMPAGTPFVWMGPARKTGMTYYVEQYIKTYNLNVRFLTEQSTQYFSYFNACDGFCLTSREDSYPIVMREASVLGKPIVGFNSGGISEFVKPGMGEMVEGFYPKALAEAMMRVQTGQTVIDKNKLQSAITSQTQQAEAKRWIETLEGVL